MATTKVSGELVDLNESTSESGLKIPTGTNANRPATDVAGMIRNNTNETSESSASCEEYYSGAAWKKINNVAFPPPQAFKTVIWTGNGTSQSITGVGFQPDFVWGKERSNTSSNELLDTTRGVTNYISTNLSNAQGTSGQGLQSFDADGFTVGNDGAWNQNGETYVAWCWKANGGTTSSNTDGSTTSTVQANTAAGISIVQYTGTGANASVGHGLGVAPELLIIKKTSGSSDWVAGVSDWTKYLEPNGTSGFRTANVWQDTAPTNSVFTLTSGGDVNGSGSDYIAYAFASIDGFSKIGTYTGNGNTGQSITGLGFSPNFLLIKITDATDNWVILDSVRGGTNILAPNSTAQEYSESGVNITFDTDGFSLSGSGAGQGQVNGNGNSYIYMAFLTA